MTTDPEVRDYRGPHAWLNWQAQREGLPPRDDPYTDSVLLRPLWEEFGLYSDAPFVGELEFGPYELLLAFARERPSMGRSQLQLVLRARDHLLGPSSEPMNLEEQDVAAYTGGDLGDQIAALISLATARRVRSGGVMRHRMSAALEGKPFFGNHQVPMLVAPTYRPLLPAIASEVQVATAEPYLDAFANLEAGDAVALQRAANQYAKALWWADDDPRISWMMLFGALEAAADRWDAGLIPDPVSQLRRRHGGMVRQLERDAPDAIPIVAKSLSRVLGAESKMIDFVLVHDPAPTQPRTAFAPFDWSQLESALRTLYDHRSRDLHGGIPFPEPLCQGPIETDSEVAEVFPALGAASVGGSWPAAKLPMYLHTFVSIVGDVLRKWWLSLPRRD